MRYTVWLDKTKIADCSTRESADAVWRLVVAEPFPYVALGVSIFGLMLTSCHSHNPPVPTVVPPVASQPAHKPPKPDCTKR